MENATLSTRQKALILNLDATTSAGVSSCEVLVPPAVAATIRAKKLFDWKPSPRPTAA